MNDPLDMPVLALTSDGETHTTAAKALGLTPDKVQLRKSLADLDRRIAILKPLLLRDQETLRKKRILKEREARIVSLVKAEITRRKTAQVVASTEKTKRRIEKLRRRTEEMELAKGQAEQMLADLLDTQAASLAHLDQLSARVETVYRNAERAYGSVAKQEEMRRTAELAKEDQQKAMWRDLAANTSEPTLRTVYLARAEGEEIDDEG